MLFSYLILSPQEQLTLVCDWAHCSSTSPGVLAAQRWPFAHHALSWLFQASPDSHSSRVLQHAAPPLSFSPFPFVLHQRHPLVYLTGSSAEHWTGKLQSCAGVSSVPARASLSCLTESKAMQGALPCAQMQGALPP